MKSTVVFWLIVATAFVLRAIPAFTAVEDYLEKEEFIPAAMSISWHHLPIREYQHPAMPAYLIKLSSLLFGTSLTGYRFLNVLCGVGSVVLIYGMAKDWWGVRAARFSAVLLAINAYHITVSALAFDLGYDIFFNVLAMYCFSRFLLLERADWLCLAGIVTGLGFLCKEITSLLVPVYLLCLRPAITGHGCVARRRGSLPACSFLPSVPTSYAISRFPSTSTRCIRRITWIICRGSAASG